MAASTSAKQAAQGKSPAAAQTAAKEKSAKKGRLAKPEAPVAAAPVAPVAINNRFAGSEMQEAVDRIFSPAEELKGLRFSLTVADPNLEGCPLIGCSQGFGTLCGYEMDEIIGRNCRFLVDPVPKDLIDTAVRGIARDYCNHIARGEPYELPKEQMTSWMPKAPANGVFCLQMNAKKNGDLFRNMFYMTALELDEQQYILGLQTGVPREAEDLSTYHAACRLLDDNMCQVERIMGRYFWCQNTMGNMRRQEPGMLDDPEDGGLGKPPPAVLLKEHGWTGEMGLSLQNAVDSVFDKADSSLKDFRFSVTMADPNQFDCPIVACSTAFAELCGFTMKQIIGNNCRFLLEGVPKDLINAKTRQLARSYCESVRDHTPFHVEEGDRERWMPSQRSSDDGVFLAQVNAKANGELFPNMFYLQRIELDDAPFIIGLQTHIPLDMHISANDLREGLYGARFAEANWAASRVLEANMAEVEACMSRIFWYSGPMHRQDDFKETARQATPGGSKLGAPGAFDGESSDRRKQAMEPIEARRLIPGSDDASSWNILCCGKPAVAKGEKDTERGGINTMDGESQQKVIVGL